MKKIFLAFAILILLATPALADDTHLGFKITETYTEDKIDEIFFREVNFDLENSNIKGFSRINPNILNRILEENEGLMFVNKNEFFTEGKQKQSEYFWGFIEEYSKSDLKTQRGTNETKNGGYCGPASILTILNLLNLQGIEDMTVNELADDYQIYSGLSMRTLFQIFSDYELKFQFVPSFRLIDDEIKNSLDFSEKITFSSVTANIFNPLAYNMRSSHAVVTVDEMQFGEKKFIVAYDPNDSDLILIDKEQFLKSLEEYTIIKK